MAKNVADLAAWHEHPTMIVLGAGLGLGFAAVWWHRHTLPRGWKFRETSTPTEVTSNVDMLPATSDVVVIGSGIGGLFTAALLAKVGKKVVVVEQSEGVGGCLHSFERDGFKFDVGLHNVGLVPERYGPLVNLLCEQENKVQWKQLGSRRDHFTWDKIYFGSTEICAMRSGHAKFLYDMVQKFPRERTAIEKYNKLVTFMNDEKMIKLHFQTQRLSPFAQRVARVLFGRSSYMKFHSLAMRSTDSVIRELTSDEDLITLLTAQHELAGESPDELNFLCHALLTFNTMEGAYYPIGGPGSIVKGLLGTILSHGGTVVTSARVQSILREGGAVKGIQVTSNGKQKVVRTNVVFSSVGAKRTFLLAGESPKTPTITIPDGSSHVIGFLGLKKCTHDLNLPSHNTWIFPRDHKNPVAQQRQTHLQNPLNLNCPLQVTFPSAKDPRSYSLNSNKSTCIVVLPVDPAWFNGDIDEPTNETKQADLKDEIKEKVKERLREVYPQVVENIEMFDLGTPITLEKYLDRRSSYGLRNTVERVRDQWQLRPRTSIRGLFLCGQDVMIHGVPGSIEGAIIATEAYLGYNFLDMFFWQRNLIDDLVMMYPVQSNIRPQARAVSDDGALE